MERPLRIAILLSALGFVAGCGSTRNLARDALADASLAPIAARADELKLQLLVGEVIEGPHGTVIRRHAFRVDAEYYYPASTVKLAAAAATLEWLKEQNEARGNRAPITLDTPLIYHPLFDGERVESKDETNLAGGSITIGHLIRKIGLVSDNEAYNKLYELLGQAELNHRLWRAGLETAFIIHRLNEFRSRDGNRRSPRIDILTEETPTVLPPRSAGIPGENSGIPGLEIGRGFMGDGRLVERPLSFVTKNRISLRDLQDLLVKVVRPDIDLATGGFEMLSEHRRHLVTAHTEWISDSDNPRYDRPDAFAKPMLPGLLRLADKADLQITNKIGRAYGFTIENAYIRRRSTGKSFFVTAVVYTNSDGILNDDVYEYGLANRFLADLGEVLGRRLL